MTTFRKLLLVWMMVWLPVAGALAAVMPLTGSIGVMSIPGVDNEDNQFVADMPCHSATKAGKTTFGPGCSHCALCDLAGVLAMPEIPHVAALLPTRTYMASPVFNHPSFVPEPISPPPRAPTLAI